MRTSKPTTITFGAQQRHVDAWLEAGEFTTASEIARAGIQALARERAAIDEVLKAKIKRAMANPRPPVKASIALAHMKAYCQEMQVQNAKKKA